MKSSPKYRGIFSRTLSVQNPVQTILDSEENAEAILRTAQQKAQTMLADARQNAAETVMAAEETAKIACDLQVTEAKKQAQKQYKESVDQIEHDIDLLKDRAAQHREVAVKQVVDAFEALFSRV